MKKISIVVNVYFNTNSSKENTFDHPTDLDQFDVKNTFADFFKSVECLNVPEGYKYDLYVFAIAANNDADRDEEIRHKVSEIVKGTAFKVFVITNSDVLKLRTEGHSFLSIDGYCEIRNLGFIFPYNGSSDFIIQFDDDEIVRQNYLVKMIELYEKYPHIYSLNSLYEKDDSVVVDESSDMKCWKKCEMMNDDFKRLSSLPAPVESIFGLGGNMTFKREYFSKICYPKDVPRGEDFALLLAARLIYENGNDRCGIPACSQEFKSYFTSECDMIIIHKPPVGKDKKHKMKIDIERFMMQKAFMGNYLSMDKLYELSRYIYRMLSINDFYEFSKEVYKEAALINPSAYSDEFVRSELADIKRMDEEYSLRNLFEEYKEYQKKYLNELENEIDVENYVIS